MHIRSSWPLLACAVGPVVLTGRRFAHLPSAERAAVLAHEQGHAKGWHTFKRIWWLLTLRKDLSDRCWQQEFEADEYAARQGHGVPLIKFLSRRLDGPSMLHPPTLSRINAIYRITLGHDHGKR